LATFDTADKLEESWRDKLGGQGSATTAQYPVAQFARTLDQAIVWIQSLCDEIAPTLLASKVAYSTPLDDEHEEVAHIGLTDGTIRSILSVDWAGSGTDLRFDAVDISSIQRIRTRVASIRYWTNRIAWAWDGVDRLLKFSTPTPAGSPLAIIITKNHAPIDQATPASTTVEIDRALYPLVTSVAALYAVTKQPADSARRESLMGEIASHRVKGRTIPVGKSFVYEKLLREIVGSARGD